MANTGNAGYPLGTNVTGIPLSTAKADDYHDAFYKITNPAAGKFMAVSSGTPGLSQPGLTTAQGHYQALLNIDTGTYRLINRATGNCLSGPQLSVTPNALLVDAPYLALPDQDWILDPLGGADFQLINQWSGLVIGTQGGGTANGTPLVQGSAASSASQKWQFVQDSTFPKKGCGGTNFATTFNASWAYNWGPSNKNVLPAGVVFNPMQWGNYNWLIDTNGGPLWQNFPAWRKTAASHYLLGFNEPDQTNQANFDVATGITAWPRLMAMDMPLVSPAPASLSSTWITDFYTQADALGYRVDYTAGHLYPGPSSGSSQNLIDSLQTAYTTWNRPVWLTEFSFVNWDRTGTWTEEDNYNCLAEFLWRAEGLSWLRKYALFRFKADAANPNPAQPWSAVGPRSNAHDANDNLTPFGELYAAWDNDASIRTNKTYHIHNKNTRKRLANTLASTANAKNIRTNDSSVQWTLVPKPASSLYYMVSSRDGRRLSYVNAGSVSLVAAGTTGTAVEWGLTEDQHGWFFVEHPITAKRLKLEYDNGTEAATFSMVSNANTGAPILWRFIVTAPRNAWKGTSGTSWTTAGNWTSGAAPATGNAALFDTSSTANLATVLNQDFNLWGLTLTSPSGSVSIGGTHNLILGGSGIDLSVASQNLSISAPLVVNALQGWNIASGRTLSLSGTVTSNHDIHVSGAGKVVASASNILPNGPTAGDLVLNATLDLNATSQTINGLSGNGIVDNQAAGAAFLTIANDDASNASNTFDGVIQNTNGTLALIKTGAGGLTLKGANTHSGGTTLNGSGGIYPKTDSAFGTGPVVINGGTLYATGGNYTFSNALTLSGGTLRVGGANSSTIEWTGPVNVTADSGISSDGSTSGVTISGNVDMQGAVFTNSGTVQNNLNGIVSGTGTIRATSGFLNFANSNTFSGTLRATSGQLKISHADGFKFATLDMNAADTGTVNLGSVSPNLGALTGSRNLGLGSSGRTVSIGFNGASTSYSGVMSGGATFQKVGGGSLTLYGTSTYSGTTVIDQGRLIVGADAPSGVAGALGNSTSDVLLGTSNSGSFARILTNGPFTVGRNIRLRTTNNTDTGTRILYLGSETAHDSVFSGNIILGSANNTAKGVSLTAAAGGQVTISGVIQDPTGQDVAEATAAAALTAVNKIGEGTVILANTNSYAGKTSVSAGTLRLGANNALPDATAVSIGASTMDAATFTDTVGTLDVTTLTSKINLGSGAALAFANSSAVLWTGGKLNITGTFVPGVSLRFGTDNTGLTSIQLGFISAPGFTTFSLTNQGYLTATGAAHPYDTWSGSAPYESDSNADGVENGLAWMLGATDKDTSALNKLPVPTQAAGALTLTFDCLNGSDRGSAVLIVQSTSDLGQQPTVWAETTVPTAPGTFTTGIVDFEITDPGAPGGLLHVEATIPVGEAAAGKLFGRLKSIRSSLLAAPGD